MNNVEEFKSLNIYVQHKDYCNKCYYPFLETLSFYCKRDPSSVILSFLGKKEDVVVHEYYDFIRNKLSKENNFTIPRDLPLLYGYGKDRKTKVDMTMKSIDYINKIVDNGDIYCIFLPMYYNYGEIVPERKYRTLTSLKNRDVHQITRLGNIIRYNIKNNDFRKRSYINTNVASKYYLVIC